VWGWVKSNAHLTRLDCTAGESISDTSAALVAAVGQMLRVFHTQTWQLHCRVAIWASFKLALLTARNRTMLCYTDRVVAVSLDCHVLWQVEVGAATACALSAESDLVFVASGNYSSTFVLALNATSGQIVWKRAVARQE